MPIWKLEPVTPLEDYHWQGSRYAGVVIVRADDEISARGVAHIAFGIVPVKLPAAEVPLIPWSSARLSTCDLFEDSEYEDEGPEGVLGPDEALARSR